MDVPIDLEDLQGKIGRNKTYFVNNVMMPHIPYNVDSKEGWGFFSLEKVQILFQKHCVWIAQTIGK